MRIRSKSRVIDPTKVVRPALQDAASTAGPLLTAEAAVADHSDKDSAPSLAGGIVGNGF
jgi:chaperonin GroEL